MTYKVEINQKEKIRRIDMSRMKKKYVFILGKKDEILCSFDNTVVFAGNMKKDTNDNNKQKGSGYLVLLLSTINEPKHEKKLYGQLIKLKI